VPFGSLHSGFALTRSALVEAGLTNYPHGVRRDDRGERPRCLGRRR
jgi:hypothetical protein